MNTKNDFMALIVGGSSGMGFQTAKRLMRRGVELILVSHSTDRLEEAKA